MYKGVSREDYEKDKLANARALGDSSDDDQDVPRIEQGKDGSLIVNAGKISKEEAIRQMIERQIEEEKAKYENLELQKKNA